MRCFLSVLYVHCIISITVATALHMWRSNLSSKSYQAGIANKLLWDIRLALENIFTLHWSLRKCHLQVI